MKATDVQRYPIGITIIPTSLTHEIECFCVSVNGWLDNFHRNFKFKFHGSHKYHVHIISTLSAYVKRSMLKPSPKGEGVRFAPPTE